MNSSLYASGSPMNPVDPKLPKLIILILASFFLFIFFLKVDYSFLDNSSLSQEKEDTVQLDKIKKFDLVVLQNNEVRMAENKEGIYPGIKLISSNVQNSSIFLNMDTELGTFENYNLKIKKVIPFTADTVSDEWKKGIDLFLKEKPWLD